MLPADIQRHIDNDTLLDMLMRETAVTPHERADGRLMLEMSFPEWYTRYISEASRANIEALIRENALRAHSKATTPDDPTGDESR